MTGMPEYGITAYSNSDNLPDEAEAMFAEELEYSRKAIPSGASELDRWRFACVCAGAEGEHVLGGVHLDIGPVNSGPLANELLAFIEGVHVRPEYRRRGIGSRVLRKAVAVARDAGCLHMRCNVAWDNPAGVALYRSCGFALPDITGAEGGEYLVVRPLRM